MIEQNWKRRYNQMNKVKNKVEIKKRLAEMVRYDEARSNRFQYLETATTTPIGLTYEGEESCQRVFFFRPTGLTARHGSWNDIESALCCN